MCVRERDFRPMWILQAVQICSQSLFAFQVFISLNALISIGGKQADYCATKGSQGVNCYLEYCKKKAVSFSSREI